MRTEKLSQNRWNRPLACSKDCTGGTPMPSDLSSEIVSTREYAAGAEIDLLQDLCRAQWAHAAAHGLHREIEHLRAQLGARTIIERRLRNLDMIQPYISGCALDWGCNH